MPMLFEPETSQNLTTASLFVTTSSLKETNCQKKVCNTQNLRWRYTLELSWWVFLLAVAVLTVS
jgi:hypothetical protein